MGPWGLRIPGVTERMVVPELAEFPSTAAGKLATVSEPRSGFSAGFAINREPGQDLATALHVGALQVAGL